MWIMLRFLRIAGIVVTTLVLAAASPVNTEKPKCGVIPTGEFHRIERAGRDAGFAEACQVEWNQFHTAFMKKEGRKRWTRRHLSITRMSPAGALKKIERANTRAEQAGVPSSVPHAPRKYMSNVALTIGESLRLGRTTSERDV
jgi:hypothetical protein